MKRCSIVLFILAVLAASINSRALFTIHSAPANSLVQPPGAEVATNFYKSITSSVRKADGRFMFKLYSGTSTTKVPGTPDVSWVVSEGTVATVDFEYADGEWKKLTMDFGSRPITVKFKHLAPTTTGKQSPFQVKRIRFRNDGRPSNYYDANLTPQPIPELLSFPELRQHLKMPQEPGALFRGQTFAGLSNQPQQVALSVQQVSLPVIEGVGLSVNLTVKAGAQIVFGNPPAAGAACASNLLSLSQDSDLVFTSLSYNTDGQHTSGKLTPVKFQLHSGCLTADGTTLRVGSGGLLQFASLQFSPPANATNPVIEGIAGQLSGPLTNGSTVLLANTDNRLSHLEPGNGSTTELRGLNLSVFSQQTQAISVSGGSFDLVGASGQFVFDKADYVLFDSSRLRLNLQPSSWRPDTTPIVRGLITAYSASAKGGEFSLNSATRLLISSGRLVSDNISVDSSISTPISGEFTEVALNLARQSSLGVTNKFLIKAAEGATATVNAGQHLTFRTGQQGPYGDLMLHLPIESGNLMFGTQGSAQLASGKVDATVTRAQGQLFRGTMSGEMRIGTGTLDLNQTSRLNIEKGTLVSHSLVFDESVGIHGAFSSVNLDLAVSTVSLPGKVVATSTDAATAVSSDAALPFEITNTGSLTGTIKIHIPIQSGTLTLGTVGFVELAGGYIDATLVIQPGQPITGTLSVLVQLGRGTLNLNPGSVLNITNGAIRADALSLGGPNGVSGVFANVDFTFDKSTVNVPGSFSVATKAGGRFNAKFVHSPLTITPDGNYTGRIDLRLPIQSGLVKLGKRGELTLSDGYINLDLNKQSGKPLVATLDTSLTAAAGHFILNKDTTLNISHGSLQAKDLKMVEGIGIVGPFLEIDFDISPSDISIPRSIKFSASGNVRLLAANTADPLTLSPDGRTLTGAVLLTSNFSALYLSPQATSVSLTNGNVRLPLKLHADNSVSGTDMSIGGEIAVTVAADDSGTTGTTSIQTSLTNCNLFANDEGSTINGKWNGEISSLAVRTRVPAVSIPETTAMEIRIKNARTSPIDLYARLKSPVKFDESDFLVNSRGLSLATTGGIALLAGTDNDQDAFQATLSFGGGGLGFGTKRGQKCEFKCEKREGSDVLRCRNDCISIEIKIPRPDCDFKVILKRSEYTFRGNLALSVDKNRYRLRLSDLKQEGDLQVDNQGCREQIVFDLFESVLNIAGAISIQDPRWTEFMLRYDFESDTLSAEASPELKELFRGTAFTIVSIWPSLATAYLERMLRKKLGETTLVFPKFISVTNRATPDSVSVNGEVVYSIDVTNGGPSGATGVVLTNTLSGPAIVTEVTPSQGVCSQAGSQITCNLGDIGKGGLVTITLKVRPTAPGVFSNIAVVKANEADELPLDNVSEEVTTVR